MTASDDPTSTDKYEILKPIGRGGMGEVVLALDLRLQRQVAIKFLRKDLPTHNWREHHGREARLLAQLNHPNIVQIYDIFEQDDAPALVMEYVDGRNLHIQSRERQTSLEEILRWLSEISAGLAAAHEAGIAHNDLKAENVLIGFDGVAKVTDFGIANADQDLSQDVFALGALAKTLLEDQSDTSPALDHLINELTSKNAGKRPSARDAHARFRHAWHESTQSETPMPGQETQASVAVSKRSLALAAIIIASGVIAWLAWDRSPPAHDYIAILPTTMDVEAGKATLDLVDLQTSVQQALKQSVIETPGMALISSGEFANEQGSLAERAEALKADELIVSTLHCNGRRCELSLERLSGANLEVINQRSSAIHVALTLESYNIVQRQWQQLYPDSATFDDPSKRISEDDYRTFLRLYQASHAGSRRQAEVLDELEALMARADRFMPLYLLYAHSALEVFDQTGDAEILEALEAALTNAGVWAGDSILLQQSWFSLAMARKDFNSAALQITALQQLGADEALVHLLEADRHRYMGNYAEADKHYEMATVLRPTRKMYIKMADNYRRSGKFDDAIATYEKSLMLFPADARDLDLLGLTQIEKGDLDGAVVSLKAALDIRPSTIYRNDLGLAYMLQGEYELARQELQAAYDTGSRLPILILNLADAEALLGNHARAHALYEQLVLQNQNDDGSVSLSIISQAYAQLGQYQQAIATLKQIGVEEAESAFNAALVYALSEQSIAALVEVERALEEGFGAIWFNLPWFDSLCTAEKFSQLLSEAGLPERCVKI